MTHVDDRMTPTAWGATQGLSKQAAHKAVQRCGIPKDERGLVSKAVADALYLARTRPRAKVRPVESDRVAPAEDPALTYQEARRRQAVADALRAELDLRERCGELVDAAAARAALQRQCVEAREALLQVPARLSAVLASESDVAAVHRHLTEAMHRALAALSGRAGQGGPVDAALLVDERGNA